MNCVEWEGRVNAKGYGVVDFGSVEKELAHRLAWARAHGGPIPRGMMVLHSCDNPRCVNLAHLRLGTHADNMRDMSEHGRAMRGRKHPKAKLTDDAVREIRRRRAAGEEGTALAREFGVSSDLIYRVAKGIVWRHVGEVP